MTVNPSSSAHSGDSTLYILCINSDSNNCSKDHTSSSDVKFPKRGSRFTIAVQHSSPLVSTSDITGIFNLTVYMTSLRVTYDDEPGD